MDEQFDKWLEDNIDILPDALSPDFFEPTQHNQGMTATQILKDISNTDGEIVSPVVEPIAGPSEEENINPEVCRQDCIIDHPHVYERVSTSKMDAVQIYDMAYTPGVRDIIKHHVFTSNYDDFLSGMRNLKYEHKRDYIRWALMGYDPVHSHFHYIHACNNRCKCRVIDTMRPKSGKSFDKSDKTHLFNLVRYILLKENPHFLWGEYRATACVRYKGKRPPPLSPSQNFDEPAVKRGKIIWPDFIYEQLSKTIGLTFLKMMGCPGFLEDTGLRALYMKTKPQTRKDAFKSALEAWEYDWKNYALESKLKHVLSPDTTILQNLETNPLELSIEIIYKVLKHNYPTWDKFEEFLDYIVSWLKQETGKKNTLYIVSPPSACKNLLFENLKYCVGGNQFVGTIESIICRHTSNFFLEAVVGKCLAIWDEPNISTDKLEQLLPLFSGNNSVAPVKYDKQADIDPVPVLIMSNLCSNFLPHSKSARFDKRIRREHWTLCPSVKENIYQLHPKAFATVLDTWLKNKNLVRREYIKIPVWTKFGP